MNEIFIARDEDDSDGLIAWWETEEALGSDAQLSCGMDEVALFVDADDAVVGQLGPGRYLLNAQTQPALAKYFEDDSDPLDVAFVRVRQIELEFDDQAGALKDAETGLAFEPFLSSTFLLEVTDPAAVLAFNDEIDEDTSVEDAVISTVFDEVVASLGVEPPSVEAILAGECLAEAARAKAEREANAALAEHGLKVTLQNPIEVDLDEETWALAEERLGKK